MYISIAHIDSILIVYQLNIKLAVKVAYLPEYILLKINTTSLSIFIS